MQGQRHQPDYILFFTVVILCAVGVVTVFSASTYTALNLGLSAAHFAWRQLIAAFLGLGLMMGIMQMSYRIWYKWAARLMVVNLVLLFLVAIPGVGVVKAGGRRWLGHGSVTFQPSEFALIILALYLAFFFSRKVMFAQDFKKGLLPALVVTGLNFLLIFLEPDMGTALTLLGMALIVAIASGARLKPLLITIGCLFPVLVGLALSASYRSSRVTAFLHPFSHPTAAYQLLQGWTAITAGGWFGRGFGMSIEKTGYLPVPQIDFIFPVFVEEWGVVGAAALLVVFGVLIWRGFWIARHADDRFGSMLALGLTGTITVGMFINLGAVTGLLPVTGIPLPFISYGGTSLVMSLIAMGMLLSVSRYTLEEEPESDELADVIEVDEARKRAERRAQDRIIATQRPRRIAEVHPLRPRRTASPTAETHGTWRSRQEVAATRGASQRESRGARSEVRPSRSNAAQSASNRSANGQSLSARLGQTERGRKSNAERKRSQAVQTGKNWRERTQRDLHLNGKASESKRGFFRKGR